MGKALNDLLMPALSGKERDSEEEVKRNESSENKETLYAIVDQDTAKELVKMKE
jgi:hypothetical protein